MAPRAHLNGASSWKPFAALPQLCYLTMIGTPPTSTPSQVNFLPPKFLTNNIPFAEGMELIVNVSVNNMGMHDIYINDLIGLGLDLPECNNRQQSEAAPLLAINACSRHIHDNEPIPCHNMAALHKLSVEGGTRINNRVTHPRLHDSPTRPPLSQPPTQNPPLVKKSQWAVFENYPRLHARSSPDEGVFFCKSKRRRQHESVSIQAPNSCLLVRLMPHRPWRLQPQRLCMTVLPRQQCKIHGVKQSP